MDQRSPVPEWFGGGNEQGGGRTRGSTGTSAGGGGVGCIAFLLGIAIAIGAIVHALSANKRAERAEREVASARQELARSEERLEEQARNHEVALSEAAARKTPAPSAPPAPTADSDGGQAATRDLAKPIAELRSKIRACYQNALSYAPDAEGRIAVSLSVAPSGDVESVKLTTVGNLPQQVSRCVESVAKTARFGPGGSDTVNFPLVFVSQ